jgi:hypothetical protein
LSHRKFFERLSGAIRRRVTRAVLTRAIPAKTKRLIVFLSPGRQAYDLLSGLYSTDRFRENLRRFYRGEYTLQDGENTDNSRAT